MPPLLTAILAALLVVLIIMIIKTLQFKPTLKAVEPSPPLTLNKKRIVESLKAMIRFKTVSYVDKSKEDPKPFELFKTYLVKRYPWVETQATLEYLGDRAILIHLKGSSKEAPLVLMSHYDVVPKNGEWAYDPFLGDVIEDRVYGRGALDTKGTLCSIMEAVHYHLEQKKPFKRDLYLAFGGDEEIRGGSADMIVEHLRAQGIQPAMVLDEGGAIVEGMFPGVSKPIAVIGTAEKGFMAVTIKAQDAGGHASTPPKESAITILANAITRLNDRNLFPVKRNLVMDQMFDTLGRHSDGFMMRMIFANLWLTFPLLRFLAKRKGGQLLSMLRTTQAFTMMNGSEAINVLPSEASIGINYRIIIGEDGGDVETEIRQALADLPVEVIVDYTTDPTSVSHDDKTYDQLTKTIRKVWPDVITTPYLMMAATDSRYYHKISQHVYRFSAMPLSKEEFAMIHASNESIHVDNLINTVRFYIQLIEDFN